MDSDPVPGEAGGETCRNCGAALGGAYCARCGQRARVRVLSLWALLREVAGELLDLDSRMWRTLRPLAFSPGRLTQEYLRGRRATYTPPFRMYLILSLAFFLANSMDDKDLELQLDVDGVGRVQVAGEVTPGTGEAPAAPAPGLPAASPEDCSPENLAFDPGPFGERYGPRLLEACRKIVGDAQGFGRAAYANIPRMMFVFLPLVAGLMTLLYLGSGRYYVEHLLFSVHFHAFFFLATLVVTLLGLLGGGLAGTWAGSALSAASNTVAVVLLAYLPWYLYRSMRVVYGEGPGRTVAKMVLLGAGYSVFLLLTGLGLLVYTALNL